MTYNEYYNNKLILGRIYLMKRKMFLCLVVLCTSLLSPLTANAAINPIEISQALQQNSEAYMTGPDGETHRD